MCGSVLIQGTNKQYTQENGAHDDNGEIISINEIYKLSVVVLCVRANSLSHQLL
jgi:hypothetical protein